MSALSQYHDLILCVVSALEARDSYTSFHSSRVAEMVEALCRFLGITGDQEELFHISAHLHDVGKIGIRDDVLLKAGRLNDEEWEIMKSHSLQGYEILRKAKLFENVAIIVRGHHERWDGKGYPDGLSGANIPLGSRIIAIADSIDAMISDRPYRKGMDVSICKEEIKKNAGIMYDPDVVKVALENWDDLIKSGTAVCAMQS
ncbi:HDIG domain-containing protein [Fibrobacter sp. UWH9]|uniref:HD-GYP domain-containing protein n=1 Tax=unclassified Fibrobacter TaxID=2634177 RepID=UPI000923605B|nr:MULTISPECIES: HD-GYP domain-containing protein [Fibrobacter]MCL4101422.1 3'3'-cGAMP-specific phosphodiesterase 2 [Fibrobacter succinogenes]MDO4947727.1 HD-GYP domain-containing protein [Fibrobacter sp.]SHH01792.1 HDIG domain-containing protein [Fibrobacter sp. UWH9]